MTARFSQNQGNTRGHRPRLQLATAVETTFCDREGLIRGCRAKLPGPEDGAIEVVLPDVGQPA